MSDSVSSWGCRWSTPAAVALAASCALAVLVNLSQFACLGRFTAGSYQARLIWLAARLMQQALACRAPHGKDS